MRKEELFAIIGEVDEQKVAAAGMAMTAKKKSRPAWLKWGAVAACLCLVVGLAIPRFLDHDNTLHPGIGETGDLVPMIYVNNSLYQYAAKQPNLASEESKFVFLGEIESKVDESQEPKENFQANDDIVGAKVYQYGSDIVVLIDDKYCLYEPYGGVDTRYAPFQKTLDKRSRIW